MSKTFKGFVRQHALESGLSERDWLIDQLNKHGRPAKMARKFGCSNSYIGQLIDRYGLAKKVTWYVPNDQ